MNLVELPLETQTAVIALVIALVGVLIRGIANYVPWLGGLLEKYKEEYGTTLGVILVNALQAWLPGGEWASVSVLGVELVVAVIVVLLAKAGLRKMGVRGLM